MDEGADDPGTSASGAGSHPSGQQSGQGLGQQFGQPFGKQFVHRSLAGKLLLSPPWMDDPNFSRSVVLLLAHTEDGAFGVVLNDESTTGVETIADVVGPAWAAMLAPPESIFVGGPCQTSSVIALGMIDRSKTDEAGPTEGPEASTHEIVVVDLNQDAPQSQITRIRLFAGYAGWAPMQLEFELARNGWFVAEALVGDGLTDNPEELWIAIMARNGNPYARIPVDPTLN